jgi:hypothetical protein
VAERERARRDDQHAEEAQAVADPAAEDRARDQVQEREQDDLLVVRGASTRGEADDLEHRGELDQDVEHARAQHDAGNLEREDDEDDRRVDVLEPGATQPRLGREHGEREAREERAARPPGELAAQDQRDHAQGRERVGHDPMDEPEPHAEPRARP